MCTLIISKIVLQNLRVNLRTEVCTKSPAHSADLCTVVSTWTALLVTLILFSEIALLTALVRPYKSLLAAHRWNLETSMGLMRGCAGYKSEAALSKLPRQSIMTAGPLSWHVQFFWCSIQALPDITRCIKLRALFGQFDCGD